MDSSKTIAIVGAGGIFPGSDTPGRFWENITNGVNLSDFPPEGRWPVTVKKAYHSEKGRLDRVFSKKACFVNGFKLNPEGLDIDRGFLSGLDPLFHFLLHAGKEAFFDAETTAVDRRRTGVIVGNIALPTEKSSSLAVEYLGKSIDESLFYGKSALSYTPTHPVNRYVTGLPAGILAKSLGLGGGTMTLDAACASSLYAISLASQKLITGRADAMLAGGVSRPDPFYTQMGFSQLNALSPDGKSSPFDSSANGLVVGEGAGVFLLKRLEDAIRHNDRIYALIRGTGLSNDVGGGLLAPDPEGQLRAMRQAYESAGLAPSDIDLIECHATGTPLGDSVEFQSLTSLWKDVVSSGGSCVIGSVKSNIGHLLTAAGAAGLMKVLLSLKNNKLPPTANFRTPAKQIPISGSPFRILTETEPWVNRGGKDPRRAAVSAFGFGGINAHMIVEEWLPEAALAPPDRIEVSAARERVQFAIVGMDADFGPWDSLRKFTERVLGKKSGEKPYARKNWWGVEKSEWFKKMDPPSFRGFYKREVLIPLDTFRVPPKELEQMLPQQSLMLKVASGAIKDAGIEGRDLLETGVFIGMALDMNTTNFHLRWRAGQKAEKWSEDSDLKIAGDEIDQWLEKVRECASPPLTANRTIGSLGSIIASRIAREHKMGGPAFTVSSEETSAFSAIETALAFLEKGSIRQAVVGAVDLPGDVRTVLTTHQLKRLLERKNSFTSGKNGEAPVTGEGAGAVVLKRLADAVKDGSRIYATISGMGFSSGGAAESCSADKEACLEAAKDACKAASIPPSGVGLVEAGSLPEEESAEFSALSEFYGGAHDKPGHGKKIAMGSTEADTGNTQAASGIASLIKVSLSLFYQIIPGIRGVKQRESLQGGAQTSLFAPLFPQYWLHNSSEGPRRAAISGFSTSGNVAHMVLEEGLNGNRVELKREAPLGFRDSGLFVLKGNSIEDIIGELRYLEKFLLDSPVSNMDRLAGMWFQKSHTSTVKGRALAIVSDSFEELRKKIADAWRLLQTEEFLRDSELQAGAGVFFTASPLGAAGKLAFVYPGSGNHFQGMGREISSHWPGILRDQERCSRNLKGQYLPETFWNNVKPEKGLSSSISALLGQVAAGTLFTDLLRFCGLRPDAVIGYSLGETTGLFALNAWRDRDGMVKRIADSSLFRDELAGEYTAARKKWNLARRVQWVVGLVDRTEEEVLKAVSRRERVYLLIVNTPKECIIGGEKEDVKEAVREMGSLFISLKDVTVAHCDVVEAVKDSYRALHLFQTFPPEGVRFYSGASGKSYELNTESAADSILNHALYGIHFPNTVRQAYRDGVRIFVEPGPGNSCTRMIGDILVGRPHMAGALSVYGESEADSLLLLLARLISENVQVDLLSLYSGSRYGEANLKDESTESKFLKVKTGGEIFEVPTAPRPVIEPPSVILQMPEVTQKPGLEEPENLSLNFTNTFAAHSDIELMKSMRETSALRAQSHERFLNLSTDVAAAMERSLSIQMALLKKQEGSACVEKRFSEREDYNLRDSRPVFLDRRLCLEFAAGRIGNVLGMKFAEADSFPTRVRLPDEPLMLVDRILSVEGEALSMTGGRIITEHDIHKDSWYLDCNRIPTCIAVESGQADLFLSAYLGIDFKTRGLSMYRLLDAVVTFHREMPGPGETILYDIRIDHFFRQGETWLFRFGFEASVNGEPLLTMSDGCAGFFSPLELAAGRGIVKSSMEKKMESGLETKSVEHIVPMKVESYSESRIRLLRKGDLAGCFGELFGTVNIAEPVVIPGGLMELVHRVTHIDPAGGRFNQGVIRAEADIKGDDWFLTCHFVDDRVMPGTLMFECCLHTLRIYLLRMGWVFESGEVTLEPVNGVASRLKCRGQVTEGTKVAVYEIHIKETGYGPEPYAIVDAVMYADEKPIVEITDMSILFRGADREKILAAWGKRGESPKKRTLYDNESILAFSNGKPSEAFGKEYEVFDRARTIARLPGPPYKFLDRITGVEGDPWVMSGEHSVEAEYNVPAGEWYFTSHRQERMPFSVLLEIALQPCGWLAAYMGSALTSETDLCFRNLGGSAIQYKPLGPETGLLTTNVRCTKVSSSAGMIIQNYDFEVSGRGGQTLYKGDTYFGFFTREALKSQVGIRGALPFQPAGQERGAAKRFPYPEGAPYPEKMLRMIDEVTLFLPQGGAWGCGFVEGVKRVDPDEWFFKAHFHQDPVCPGSLGLESFLQLVKLFAGRRWGGGIKNETVTSGEKHEWIYRGQILPTDREVLVQARIESVDDENRRLHASGYLSVDGRLIYQMNNFGVQYEQAGF